MTWPQTQYGLLSATVSVCLRVTAIRDTLAQGRDGRSHLTAFDNGHKCLEPECQCTSTALASWLSIANCACACACLSLLFDGRYGDGASSVFLIGAQNASAPAGRRSQCA